MLAENSRLVHSGGISADIHLPATMKLELMDFIAGELPVWRDHPDRPKAEAETHLTGQLCDHLNSAVSSSAVWDYVRFRTEIRDETCGRRTIDLAAKPLGHALVIENRRHSQFDMLFPIECKRLPTPKGKDRDEREYVITAQGTTGGIQRFKLGCHGAAHTFVAMIAFVQDRSCSYWLNCVNHWIQELSTSLASLWGKSDLLRLLDDDGVKGVCALSSQHRREQGLSDCEMRHLWVKMHDP